MFVVNVQMHLGKMQSIVKNKSVICAFIVILIFIADLTSKNAILKNPYNFYSYLSGLLNIHLVKNTGVAFGMFKGYNTFFIIFNSLILIFLFYFKRKIKSTLSFFAIHFIIGGAIANIYDRIKYGFVVDFIDLKFFPAVFNFADFSITIGVIMIIIDEFLKKEER